MSKRKAAYLAIVSVIVIVIATVLISLSSQLMLPLNGSQGKSTPVSSTEPVSREDQSSNATLQLDRESVPSETTGTQYQELREVQSSNTTLQSDRESVPSETTGTQDQELRELEDGPDGIVESRVNYTLFENSGIRMEYPSDWQITGDSSNYDGMTDIAKFVSAPEDRFDTYMEGLRLSLDMLPQKNTSLEEYFRDLRNYKSETIQNFSLLDYNIDSNVLAGYPAYRIIYTRSLDNGLDLKEMEIGTKVDNKVYFLVYSAQEEKYADFLPIIQHMINSLEFDRGI